jgi:adenylosuccinate synthase
MGLGVAPRHIGEVMGVIKAYCTRVGSGPFVTELHDETGERIRKAGHEFGSTTGRPRRTGWLDLPALRYVNMLNGTSQLIITKADVLTCMDHIKICVAYDMNGEHVADLNYHINPETVEPVYQTLPGWTNQDVDLARIGRTNTPINQYIHYIEQATSIKVSMLSLGPERENLFVL